MGLGGESRGMGEGKPDRSPRPVLPVGAGRGAARQESGRLGKRPAGCRSSECGMERPVRPEMGIHRGHAFASGFSARIGGSDRVRDEVQFDARRGSGPRARALPCRYAAGVPPTLRPTGSSHSCPRVTARIPLPRDQIAAFCEEKGITRFSLFGSVLRDDFGPESDVDVLVEFDPDVRFGLLELVRMERELGEILGRKADMHVPSWLKPWLRDKVVGSAELFHERPR